jgi:hypothetical protein
VNKRHAQLGSVVAALAAATLLATPAMVFPARADSLSDHAFANAASATLLEPDSQVNLDLSAGWRNVYPSGGTFFTATTARGDKFPQIGRLAGGSAGALLLPDDAGRERYRLIQEFDNPNTGIERFEATISLNTRSGAMPTSETSVAVDYFAGSIAHFGFEGPARRFDLYASYTQTLAGHLLEISPTYSLPLDARGRTMAWVSVTLDGPIGVTAERYGDISIGLSRQAGPRLRLGVSARQLGSRNDAGFARREFDLNLLARVSPW